MKARSDTRAVAGWKSRAPGLNSRGYKVPENNF